MSAKRTSGTLLTISGCLFVAAALLSIIAGRVVLAGMNVAIGMALIAIGVTVGRRAARADPGGGPKQPPDEAGRRG